MKRGRKPLEKPSHNTFARIPNDVFEAMRRKTAETNTTLSKLIVKALRLYLGIPE